MKIMYVRVLFGISFASAVLQAESLVQIPLAVQVNSQAACKMNMIMGLIGAQEKIVSLSGKLKTMMERKEWKKTGFSITVRVLDKEPSKKLLKTMKEEGFCIGLFLNTHDELSFEWRLYDMQSLSLIKGKRWTFSSYPLGYQAEYLADELWPILTGQEGFFSTRIAYCKDVLTAKNKIQKQLIMRPAYYTEEQKTLISGNIFAPRWNKDLNNPLLLYSEGTLSNVRLMSIDMNAKRKIVLNLEGLNAFASFSTDSSKVACVSCDRGKSNIFLYEKNPNAFGLSFKKITEGGNNSSPTLLDNGDIVFCSDFETKEPHIYYYHAVDSSIERLTTNGYCSSPCYCPKKHQIVYSKYCKGIMQLFVYDISTKTHQQLTDDSGNKEEASWSPCGNYLAYSADFGQTSRIVLLNLITKEHSFLTSAQERCCYPTWSGKYAQPLILG